MPSRNQALLAALLFTLPADAQFIDQDTGKFTTGVINAGESSLVWQQRVTANASGYLVGIDILPQGLSRNPPTLSFTFFLNVGPPWQNSPHDFQKVVTYSAQDTTNPWHYVDVSSEGIWLQPGSQFSWGVTGFNGPATIYAGTSLFYPSGELWLNGSIYQTPQGTRFDAPFRTHMIVPEPTALALATLLGVCGMMRRRPYR